MHCRNPDCPDALETGQAAEFRDGVGTCNACGHELEEGPAPASDSLQDPGPVDIARYATGQEAHLVKGQLEAAAEVIHEHSPWFFSLPVGASWVRVTVPAAQSAEAAEQVKSLAMFDAQLPLDDDYPPGAFRSRGLQRLALFIWVVASLFPSLPRADREAKDLVASQSFVSAGTVLDLEEFLAALVESRLEEPYLLARPEGGGHVVHLYRAEGQLTLGVRYGAPRLPALEEAFVSASRRAGREPQVFPQADGGSFLIVGLGTTPASAAMAGMAILKETFDLRDETPLLVGGSI